MLSLKEWEIIYIPYKRIKNKLDADDGLYFRDPHDHPHWITDWSQFYTFDELKDHIYEEYEKENTKYPKIWEEIEVWLYEKWEKIRVSSTYVVVKALRKDSTNECRSTITYALHKWFWRFPPEKTELTVAEVEVKLWLESGTLVIKSE